MTAVPKFVNQIERDTDPDQETCPAEVDEQALVLRRQSATFRAIADVMGCSLSTAFERVRRAQMRERRAAQAGPSEPRSGAGRGAAEDALDMLSRESTRNEAVRANERHIRASERKVKMTGAHMPRRRVEDREGHGRGGAPQGAQPPRR